MATLNKYIITKDFPKYFSSGKIFYFLFAIILLFFIFSLFYFLFLINFIFYFVIFKYFSNFFCLGKANTIYFYVVLEYVLDGKVVKILPQDRLQNMTVLIGQRIRDKDGNLQDGKKF